MNNDWFARAKCRAKHTDFFFPTRTGEQEVWDEIVAFCSDCPVKTECAEYAIENDIREGYWGGLSGNKRRRIAMQRKKLAV